MASEAPDTRWHRFAAPIRTLYTLAFGALIAAYIARYWIVPDHAGVRDFATTVLFVWAILSCLDSLAQAKTRTREEVPEPRPIVLASLVIIGTALPAAWFIGIGAGNMGLAALMMIGAVLVNGLVCGFLRRHRGEIGEARFRTTP